MLVLVTGRKTGKVYTTPVNYYRFDGDVVAFARKEAQWWKNARGGAPVDVLVRGKWWRGKGEVTESEALVLAGLRRAMPKRAERRPERLEERARHRVMLRVVLSEDAA